MSKQLSFLVRNFVLLSVATTMSCSNLNFTVDQCDLATDPYESPREAILTSTWVSPETLVVEAYIKEVCDGATFSGDFEISENQLNLLYGVDMGEMVTPCLCTHKVVYEISGLKKKDYSISIARQI